MLAAALILSTVARPEMIKVAPPREFRGVWVATVDNIDWPSKRTLTTDQQKAEMIRILDVADSLNLNAIIFQVRPSCDALYESKIEPWSEYLTNKQGQAPNPKYDPLAFAVAEAHKRGMELHCWFNPYRAKHPAAKGDLAANHIRNTNPNLAKEYGRYLWLDPGEPEVQQRSLDVMLDVVKRYDIDGVHIDDYFYPYAEKDAKGNLIPFPDQGSYFAYRNRGGTMAPGDWRRSNVDTFVKRLYDGIKKTKKWVKFGISPFGIYRPNVPEGIKAGVDQYESLYADCLKWFRNGWCDYFTPQLYWPIKQTPQSYPVLLNWWASQNVMGRHLWPGNFTGRVRTDDGNWPPQEIVDQIDLTRKAKAGGNVHFSMRVFLLNAQKLNDVLKAGPYKEKALVPESPWLGKKPTSTPTLAEDGTLCDPDARWWGIYAWHEGVLGLRKVVPASKTPPADADAVTAIDAYGSESAPLVLNSRR